MLDLGAYLLGIAALALLATAAWLGATAVRHRLLPEFTGAPAHLATSVLCPRPPDLDRGASRNGRALRTAAVSGRRRGHRRLYVEAPAAGGTGGGVEDSSARRTPLPPRQAPRPGASTFKR